MSEAKSFRQLAGVPPSTASTKDSVLLIIDAQNEYAKGALKIKNVESSRKAIKDLLQRYRADGGQVIHVVHKVSHGRVAPPLRPPLRPSTLPPRPRPAWSRFPLYLCTVYEQ